MEADLEPKKMTRKNELDLVKLALDKDRESEQFLHQTLQVLEAMEVAFKNKTLFNSQTPPQLSVYKNMDLEAD